MTDAARIGLTAIVPYLQSQGGKPFLVGSCCDACGQVFVGTRSVCANCSSRASMRVVQLAETGRLYNFTIVHRSFPGVATPFVDAIVDLDDGSHVKGTLFDVECDPERIPFDLRVRVDFRELPPAEPGGDRRLSYCFVPA